MKTFPLNPTFQSVGTPSPLPPLPQWQPGTHLKFLREDVVIEYLGPGYSDNTMRGRVLKDSRDSGSQVGRETDEWDRRSFDAYPVQPVNGMNLHDWLTRHYPDHIIDERINPETLLVAASTDFSIQTDDPSLHALLASFCQDIRDQNRRVIRICG